ncbi:MAG: hypothetical protein O7D30_10970 [Rickettsia endosymbiont of Ixodes persulcatus]|nr:hypothetical protein [Rickettsia endosymbiont of Ixodes persulcatus]
MQGIAEQRENNRPVVVKVIQKARNKCTLLVQPTYCQQRKRLRETQSHQQYFFVFTGVLLALTSG